MGTKREFDIKTKLMGKGLTISTIQTGRRSFETMVFHRLTEYIEWDGQRYKTEAEARKGHSTFVAKWKAQTRKQVRDKLAEVKGSKGG